MLERVRKAVGAKEGWIKVERIRKAKGSKLILGCSTAEDRDKAEVSPSTERKPEFPTLVGLSVSPKIWKRATELGSRESAEG